MLLNSIINLPKKDKIILVKYEIGKKNLPLRKILNGDLFLDMNNQ